MMTVDSSKFIAHHRAMWRACVAFIVLATAPTLLTGCGRTDHPLAADTADPVITADDKGLGVNDDPAQLQLGDAVLAITIPEYGRWRLGNDDPPLLIVAIPGVPVQVFWQADDVTPLGSALSYRHGWNVNDPDDADDPGWFGQPGTGYKARQTQPMEICDGVQALTIECWDGDRLLARAMVEVEGMPVAPRVRIQELGPGSGR